MSEFEFQKIIKEDIKFDFHKVIDASRFLFDIIRDPNRFDIGIGNVKYILTPRASRIIPPFRMAFYPLPPYNSGRILTADDFKRFDLIEVPKVWLIIDFHNGEPVEVELQTLECDFPMHVASVSRGYVDVLPLRYGELASIFPCELATQVDKKMYNYIISRATMAISVATIVLTLLYNVCEAVDNLKFIRWPHENRYDPEAVEYGRKLVETIKKFGDSFEEVFANLSFGGSLL
jgi:hypothetical protein